MEIRLARKEDCEKITKELWVPFMEYCSKLDDFSEVEKRAEQIFYTHLRDFITHKENAILIAEENGKLIGYAKITKTKRPPVYKKKEMGEITDLFVLPEYRKKRVGLKLVKASENWFRKRNLKLAWIKVHATNELGTLFWEKNNYTNYMIEKIKKI